MIHIYDAQTMVAALAGDLDPQLRPLLEARKAALITPDYDLTGDTEFLVVQPGDTEDEIVRNIGQSPLVDPIEGARFRERGFMPHWDWLADHGGWFEMILTFGSTFAYILLIQDAEGTIPDLRAMCRHYVGDAECD